MNRTILFALVLAVLPPLSAQSISTLGPSAQRAGSAIDWIKTDPRLLEEGRNRAEVRKSEANTKDFDRSAALDEVLQTAKQQNRLVLWYVPRILNSAFRGNGAQMYRPAILDGYVQSTFFTDPDCVALLNRQFLKMRLVCDKSLGERFDIQAPDTVEPAFFILSPDGAVVRKIDRIRSFNSHWFYRVLLDCLAAHPGCHRKTPRDAVVDPVMSLREDRLDGFVPDGNLIHQGSATAELANLHLEHARALRLHGHLDRALGLLESASSAASEREDIPRRDPLESAISCERGRVLLLKGQLSEAAAAFRRCSGPSKAEAMFHLGVCEFFDRNDTFAIRHWKEAAIADPESPWATKAAVNLIDGNDRTPIGATIHGFEDPLLSPAPTAQVANTSLPRTPKEAQSIAKASLQYLLRMQRESGGWSDSRYAYWPSPEITPNVWVAATSLACTALLEWRDLQPDKVDAALTRGEQFMFDERRMARGFQEEIYADAYKLFYLARKFDLTEANARGPVVERMNSVINHIVDLQGAKDTRGAGFWGHEYPNPFTTAAVMNALVHARERGARVPKVILERGAAALVTVRSEGGSYGYGAGRKPRSDSEEQHKNSMGRDAICEAALKWTGHELGTTENVKKALDNFWTNLPRLERIRVCDFHTDGELGGFFFWHAIFHTTESINALPESERGAHRARMLEFITTIGELDGSFIDSHEIGKSYGTAMGLLTLKRILPDKP